MKLDHVYLYGDTGYCLGGHHVCHWSEALDTDDALYDWANVKSSKDSIFNLDLPIAYNAALQITYIQVEMTLNGSSQTIYGWVTGIYEIASAEKASRIAWEIDYWRTYSSQMSVGAGRILRAPTDLISNPKNQISGFKQTIDEIKTIRDALEYPSNWPDFSSQYDYLKDYAMNTMWCVVQVLNGKSIDTCFFPIYRNSSSVIIGLYDSSSRAIGLTITDIYAGAIGTMMGISPANIINAVITPMCPIPDIFTISYVASSSGWFWQVDTSYASLTVTANTPSSPIYSGLYFGYFKLTGANYAASISAISWTLNTSEFAGGGVIWEDNISSYVGITDFQGNIVWKMPYNFYATGAYCGFSIAPDANYMYIILKNTESLHNSSPEGLVAAITLPTVPVASNTWQSYNVSMQRQYDIESTKASIKNEATKTRETAGITAAESALNGAVSAGIMGSTAGPIGAAAGALAGALGGAAIGYVGTNAKADITESNDEKLRAYTQELKDAVMANQDQSLILSGQSRLWEYNQDYIGPCTIQISIYDHNRAMDEYTEFGYYVDKAYTASDLDDIIIPGTATGPWQIEHFDITGNIPVAARKAIQGMFAAGIYIDAASNS